MHCNFMQAMEFPVDEADGEDLWRAWSMTPEDLVIFSDWTSNVQDSITLATWKATVRIVHPEVREVEIRSRAACNRTAIFGFCNHRTFRCLNA